MNQTRKTPRIKFRLCPGQDFYASVKKVAYSKILPWTGKPKNKAKIKNLNKN